MSLPAGPPGPPYAAPFVGPAPAHPHPEPTGYAQLLRTWRWADDWWKALLGALVVGVWFLIAGVLTIPLLIGALAVQGAIEGTPLGDGLTRAMNLDDVTPASMLWLNLTLASMVLVAVALHRFLHHLRPRWLFSVAPGIRWRFFLACLGLSLVALCAQLVVSAFLPVESDIPSGGLNQLTGQTAAFAVVLLLTTPLQALGEEFAFRGYLMQAFGSLFVFRSLGRHAVKVANAAAILVTALGFAAAHGLQNAPLFIDRFAFGLMAGLLVVLTGGLEASIALHVLNNYVAFGFALLFGDIGSTLTVSEVSWWNLPLTITQNGVYLVLVLLVARRMGLSNRTSPAPSADPLPGGPGGVLGARRPIGDARA